MRLNGLAIKILNTRGIKDIVFMGSNDGVNFTPLDTEVHPLVDIYGSNYKRMITVDTPGFYEYYRFKVTSHYGDANYVSTGELRLYGVAYHPPAGTVVSIR